jgi:hypothetical protein
VSALRSDDERALEAAVKALAGKGIGLTPAGDDWLLGCIVALHCLGQHPKANLIARIARAQTTVFSASILHMAGQGKHAQTWHDLLNAATPPQIRAAVYHVLQHGHTSGADALTGFIQTLDAFMTDPCLPFRNSAGQDHLIV